MPCAPPAQPPSAGQVLALATAIVPLHDAVVQLHLDMDP
jgi:hypothetical protein